MRRHYSHVLHTGVLVRRVRPTRPNVDPTRDGLLDDGLSLFLQHGDQLLLGADVAPDAPVDVIEEADDGNLFRERWHTDLERPKVRLGNRWICDSH